MNRQAFKQRMQNLKSYRENNPGKGYWDWKVEAFADGGEVGDRERQYISDWYSRGQVKVQKNLLIARIH